MQSHHRALHPGSLLSNVPMLTAARRQLAHFRAGCAAQPLPVAAEMLISPCQTPKLLHSAKPKMEHWQELSPVTMLGGAFQPRGLSRSQDFTCAGATLSLLPYMYTQKPFTYCLFVAGSCDTSDFLHPALTAVGKDFSETTVGPARHQHADACELNPDRKGLPRSRETTKCSV